MSIETENDIKNFIQQIKDLAVEDRLGKIDNEKLKRHAELGRILSIIHNKKLYQNWGYKSFRAFYRELGYSGTMVKIVMRLYNVMAYLWEVFQIDQSEYVNIGIMKLSMLLPYLVKLKTKEEVLNLLETARLKNYVQLRDIIAPCMRIVGTGILKVHDTHLVLKYGFGTLRCNTIANRKVAPDDLENKLVKFVIKEIVK